MDKMTTVWISERNKKRMDGIGGFKESYNDVLGKILDLFEETKSEHLIEEKMK